MSVRAWLTSRALVTRCTDIIDWEMPAIQLNLNQTSL